MANLSCIYHTQLICGQSASVQSIVELQTCQKVLVTITAKMDKIWLCSEFVKSFIGIVIVV